MEWNVLRARQSLMQDIEPVHSLYTLYTGCSKALSGDAQKSRWQQRVTKCSELDRCNFPLLAAISFLHNTLAILWIPRLSAGLVLSTAHWLLISRLSIAWWKGKHLMQNGCVLRSVGVLLGTRLSFPYLTLTEEASLENVPSQATHGKHNSGEI